MKSFSNFKTSTQYYFRKISFKKLKRKIIYDRDSLIRCFDERCNYYLVILRRINISSNVYDKLRNHINYYKDNIQYVTDVETEIVNFEKDIESRLDSYDKKWRTVINHDSYGNISISENYIQNKQNPYVVIKASDNLIQTGLTVFKTSEQTNDSVELLGKSRVTGEYIYKYIGDNVSSPSSEYYHVNSEHNLLPSAVKVKNPNVGLEYINYLSDQVNNIIEYNDYLADCVSNLYVDKI